MMDDISAQTEDRVQNSRPPGSTDPTSEDHQTESLLASVLGIDIQSINWWIQKVCYADYFFSVGKPEVIFMFSGSADDVWRVVRPTSKEELWDVLARPHYLRFIDLEDVDLG